MQRTYLWIEFITLFCLVPIAYGLGSMPLPKIPLLLAVFAACTVYLLTCTNCKRRDLINGFMDHPREIKAILLRSLGVTVLSIITVLIIDPDLLFGFPRARPWLWLIVMLLYPLLSAYPQELIYRPFLFKRYSPILKSETMRIAASTLTFSLLHIIFDNWIAVILTIPAGYIFTRTYIRTNSLMLASLEHALYGCIIFTTGLGKYFYTPS